MTGRKRASVLAETLRSSGALTGPTRVIHPVILEVGCPWQFDSRRGRYLVPLASFDDLLARLEMAGHHVDVVGASLW